MKNFIVRSQLKDYSIFFKSDLKFLEVLKKLSGVWVIDRIVYNLYKKYFKDITPDSLILFDADEDQKTLEGAARIYRELINRSVKRNRSLISLGGGITQDVTGFVASTLYRGIRWIFVPTTLLAQADSCIGSKTSLNFDSFKNLLGTFYAPDEIYISTKFLDSLSIKDKYSGFGEIVKLQLIAAQFIKNVMPIAKRLNNDKEDTAGLLGLIYDSLLIKKHYIEKDEFDRRQRRILNYGHCFGHAFESVSRFAIPHGLAVVVGMLFANIIALKRKKISVDLFDVLVQNFFIPHFHMELLDLKPEFFDSKNLFDGMKKDKKRIGNGVALVMPYADLTLEIVHDLSWEEFKYGCGELKRIINTRS